MIAGVGALLAAYRDGSTSPVEVIEELIRRRAQSPSALWISQVDDQTLRQQAAALAASSANGLPLYGVPFVVKDNIDLEGLPTTAACPAFSYVPARSAFVVQRLLDAGAIVLGKTNLDQFATGLVGTRSPYGACANAFDPSFISGGSSSGSAVAVALGLAAFSLGTDTAGSGRVPAAFNNLVGYKPTLGLVSTQGVVPACRSLDAVSIFALTSEDAGMVAAVARGYDPGDPFARRAQGSPRRGWAQRPRLRVAVPVPAQREFFGNEEYARLYTQSIDRMAQLGCVVRELDIGALLEAARLLYQGPWVAERHLTAGSLMRGNPEAVLPVIREIIGGATRFNACDAFAAQYHLRELRRASEFLWDEADVLLLPTAPSHYRIDQVTTDPVALNSRLGHYTNFVNLLDLAAVAVPSGFTAAGLPFGVSLIAPAFEDEDLLHLAGRLQQAAATGLGALHLPLPSHAPSFPCGEGWIDIAVCGAHMSGLPLNGQLTGRGAFHVKTTRTAPEYRLYVLPGGPPQRPGLVRVGEGGSAIELEIWRMPAERLGDFVPLIPSPLGLGRIRISDNTEVCGFLCESAGIAGATDITAIGGWRAHVAGGVQGQYSNSGSLCARRGGHGFS